MTVVTLENEVQDFDVSAEIKQFLEGADLLEKFQKIEVLDKSIKKDKDKAPLDKFLQNLVTHARYFPQYHHLLEDIFCAKQDLQRNINTRLVLERLALKCTR